MRTSTRKKLNRMAVMVAVAAGTITLAAAPANAHYYGATTAPLDYVRIRACASTGCDWVGSIPGSRTITIQCQRYGENVVGYYGTSNIWDKVTYNGRTGYIADANVYTGSSGLVTHLC